MEGGTKRTSRCSPDCRTLVASSLLAMAKFCTAGLSLLPRFFFKPLADIQPIIAQRCVMCHNAQLASKNIRLDSPQAIQTHAQLIYQQAVVLKTMPLNNATGITNAERATLGRWFEAGAKQ